MNKPVFRVVGLDHATCDEEYIGAETATQPNSADVFVQNLSIYPRPETAQPRPDTAASVTVRLKDLLPALQRSATAQLAWIHDFEDDPIVITRDFYDVLLTYQRLRNVA